jgi:bacillithiol biosynthesis cysteine-adding enzyme BshC
MRLLSQPSGPLPPVGPRTAAWQAALDPAIVAAPGTEALLARLKRPGALAVTTGQQPGLLAGPLYAVHKPLAAAALAAELERRWQRPVVPIYWIAGDDHDYREASVTAWTTAEGETVEFRLPPRPDNAPQRSMAREPLPAEIAAALDGLAAALPAGPEANAALAWLGRHYRPGRTLHAACAGALAELLAPYGVLCLDATHPAFKRAQAPLLQRALDDAGRLDDLLLALPADAQQVTVGGGATLVFLEADSGRDRLVREGIAFRTRRTRERYTAAELHQMLADTPERFSANVLLRPVVESALLPTVAYVAGPAELRYLSQQAAVLYPAFDVAAQVPVPRWSGLVVEAWVDRLLGRLDLTAEAVFADAGDLEAALIRRAVPAPALAAIERLRLEIGNATDVLAREGVAIDPVLERAVAGRGRRLELVTDDLLKLIERHVRKRGDIAHRQFLRVRGALRPCDRPQERVLGPANWLGRYGRSWLQAVATEASRWAATLP